MLQDNIKRLRTARGMSQEELAIELHVVRQTVSKWEKGLSVPDADVLVRMAKVLDVSVGELLDMEEPRREDLAGELERVNARLADMISQSRLREQAGRKRGTILWLSFAAMFILLVVENEVAALVLSGLCMLAAVGVLYRNLSLLTRVTSPDADTRVIRLVTIVSALALLAVLLLSVLARTDMIVLSEEHEKLLAVVLIAGVMVFAGVIAPKLPFNRHTGLRLPWTVSDEETWNVAHGLLGDISLPLAMVYVGCAWTIPDFDLVTMAAMAVWIGIPGGMSYLFYRRKFFGK